MNEIPDECLYIKECKELVTRGEYESLCKTRSWIYCPQVPEEVIKKYKRTPFEWKKIEETGDDKHE